MSKESDCCHEFLKRKREVALFLGALCRQFFLDASAWRARRRALNRSKRWLETKKRPLPEARRKIDVEESSSEREVRGRHGTSKKEDPRCEAKGERSCLGRGNGGYSSANTKPAEAQHYFAREHPEPSKQKNKEKAWARLCERTEGFTGGVISCPLWIKGNRGNRGKGMSGGITEARKVSKERHSEVRKWSAIGGNR